MGRLLRLAAPGQNRRGANVYLIDDDAAVRKALTRLFQSARYRVTAFALAEDFLAAVDPDAGPCCLVVDLRMPGLSGLDLQELLMQQGLDMSMVFISGAADVESGVRAMKGGAVDFLKKPVMDDVLLEAVDRALARDRARRAERTHRDSLQARAQTLTPREREVFDLIVTGLLNKQVGAELGAAEKTIKVHRSRVMQKMAARSLAELVRMADHLGPPAAPPPAQSARSERTGSLPAARLPGR